MDQVSGKPSALDGTNSAVVKGTTLLENKVKRLENSLILLNLRFINFPYCNVISASEMLRTYFFNVLHLEGDKLPEILSVCYIISAIKMLQEEVWFALRMVI